jgi:hypothetical protein
MKYKTIKIEDVAYERIKSFCNKKRLKISRWSQDSLVWVIESNEQEEQTRLQEKMGDKI